MTPIKSLFTQQKTALRAATAQDAPALAHIHALCFPRGWSQEEFEALLAGPAAWGHMITLQDKDGSPQTVAGFILSHQTGDEAEILALAVSPAWRRRGYARRLLEHHDASLSNAGIKTIHLEVEENNMPAIALYIGTGFKTIARREAYYTRPEAPKTAALVLRLDLEAWRRHSAQNGIG